MPTPEDIEVAAPSAQQPAAEPAASGAPAAQAGPAAGGTPDLSALLGMFAGGAGGVDPMGLLRSQLGSMAGDNPALSALMQMMQARSGPGPAGGEIEDARLVEPDDELVAQADLEELLAQSRIVEAEVQALRARNDVLAAALGACHLCWGEDFGCGSCRGRGSPGARRPEPVSFRRYVTPALRRLQEAPATPGREPRGVQVETGVVGPRPTQPQPIREPPGCLGRQRG
jgi:hypothetical protein